MGLLGGGMNRDSQGDGGPSGKVTPGDLQRAPILAHWPTAALERLAAVSVMRWFEPGEVLARLWEPSRSLFIMVEGCLEMTRISASGQRYLSDLLSPPQAAGLIPMIDGRETFFETRVRQRSRVILCPNAAVVAEMEADGVLAMGVMRVISLRNRMEHDRAVMNALDPVLVRVAKAIMYLARRPGLLDGGGQPLPAPVTYEDIADFLGLSMSAVVRVVKDLIGAGAIEKRYRGLHILDSALLLAAGQAQAPLNPIARQYVTETRKL
ncbi:MAG: helix-turn-helix domain-containing protein [Caulobacter sp.]|nr:helix-turn-helix domain-containing protein [Caulobacter sp.]